MDSLSPLAAVKVLVQVIPVGNITSSAFDQVLARLTEVGVLNLEELKTPEDAGRNAFNAAAFPNGKLALYFSAATRLPSTAMLYPFETFREPFIILGIADTIQLEEQGADGEQTEQTTAQLNGFAAQLQENYPSALLHRVLAVNASSNGFESCPDVVSVTTGQALRPFLADIGGLLIPELGGLAKSFQSMSNISSPLSRETSNGSGETASTSSMAGRRGSLQTFPSSQSLADIKSSHRMSMPAHLIPNPNGTTGSRPGTPSQSGRVSPATTFDEIPGAVPPQAASRTSTPNPDPALTRDSSADRGSTSGFGSSTINERHRIKQQGRLSCIVGSLFLQSGLWSDALRELADSIAKARSCSDHLWHAKAFENAIICLLLLACNGVGFRIPDVCYPSSSRPLAARGPQAQYEGTPAQVLKPEDALEGLKVLYEMLPDMFHTIRDLYQRTVDIPGEGLTPSGYSEVNVRLARLLAGLSNRGQSEPMMYQMMQTSLIVKAPLFPRGKSILRQASEMLHVAIPSVSEAVDTSMTETLSILGAIAASYSTLGMPRKSALILQDYLDCLTPGLVQARKLGAAEAGMHPAAGIANIHELSHDGSPGGLRIDNVLGFFECLNLLVLEGQPTTQMNQETPDNIDLKLNLLRKCIRVCEALPDFNGILRCTAELLRLAGPGSAPSLRSPDVHIKIAAEEQSVLSSSFYRTSDLMDNLALTKQGGRYWDRFLVRGVELQPPQGGLETFARRATDYGSTAAEQLNVSRGPFLHDALNPKPAIKQSQAVLVAGESRSFSVLLQNLLDIDIYIDRLELVTTHGDFCPGRREIRLSPRRIHMFSVSGTPQTAGKVCITGCRVTVKGCATTEFGIYPDPWSPPEVVKIFQPVGKSSGSSNVEPKRFTLEANVLPAQPRLEVQTSSLPERAVEVHEGERKTFDLQVRNASKTASVNFMRITSQDNIKMYLLSALKERDLSPSLRYEIERQLYIEPVLQCPQPAIAEQLAPRQTKSLRFEVLGKPGLTHTSALFDYAFLEDQGAGGQIHVRMLAAPVAVTVKPSLRLASFQLAPLPQDPLGILPTRDTHCWLTLDFQNLSFKALKVCVQLKRPVTRYDYPHTYVVPPKAIASISCAIPKIYIEKAHAAIPSLDPSKEQQFVVRTSGGAPIDERDERGRFWYGNALVDSLAATWLDTDGTAKGSISLRDVSLASADLTILALHELSVLWDNDIKGEIATTSTARLKLVNRGQEALRVELQLYRTISGFVDRVAGGHVESQMLSVIKPQSEVIVELEVGFECKGHHVFFPSVIERDHAEGQLGRPFRTWHGEPKHVTIA